MKTGHTPSRNHPEYWMDCTVPWFTLADVWQLRDGRRKYLEETKEKISELGLQNSAAELLPAGTVVFSRTASIGFSGIMPGPMATSQDFWNWVCGPRLTSDYLLYVFRAMGQELQALTMGSTHKTIYQPIAAAISIPVAPLHEQNAIAALLDRETARIDALIAKKQRQIELLQEKRAALISHAVTKGLDPNVKMKHSGIEWLGQIPEHWHIKRLKFVSALQTGLTLGKKYDADNLVTRPYLRVANVQDGYLDLDTITEISLPPEDVNCYELRCSDVLMTEGGDFDKLGRGYVWEGQIPGCLHQNHIFAVRPRQHDMRSAFLAAILTSSHGKNYFTSTSQQTTNLATTNSTKLLSFPIPLPPLDEQDAVLGRIQDAGKHLESLVRKVSSSIEKLREYRAALISAAVTGKIDVRKEVP